jgi:regulator of protease activity HflC (stomatin/prohibitin superfamily)
MDLVAKVFFGILFLWIIFHFVKAIRLVPTRTAMIVESFGKYSKTLNAGFHFLIPFVDRVAYIRDLKEEAIPIEPQECFTLDNVQVEVDGVIYMSIMDPVNASYGVVNYLDAAVQLAQTTTRSIIGTIELDRTFEERSLISAKVVEALSEVADSWGICVHRYEVKNINPPRTVREAMERQMTAERTRRAMIATAEGTRQAKINDSEGYRKEMVNVSEGEKLKRINEAEGKASEILSLATATATSIAMVATAISEHNGEPAVRMKISQRYLNSLAGLATDKTEVLLPADLTQFDKVIEGIQLTK